MPTEPAAVATVANGVYPHGYAVRNERSSLDHLIHRQSHTSVFDWSRRHFGRQLGAVHVAVANIDQAPRRLRQGRPVVVMCASGSRSRVLAMHLRGFGYDAA